MRRFVLLLVLALFPCTPLSAQSVTIDALMASPFPTELIAAPTGARFAWVQSVEGVRNIWIAQAPDFKGRKITSYTADDGQDLTELAFTGDGKFVVFTRGEGPNRQGESPNPAEMPDGAEQAVWAVSVETAAAPKRLGPGRLPSPAPNSERVAWVTRGQIWSIDLAGQDSKAAQLFTARGVAQQIAWAPDGASLAFVSNRGTHSFVGVFVLAGRELHYVDPSLDRDSQIAWSPDGTHVAFVRQFASARPAMFSPHRDADEPWAIRVADIKSGSARQIFKAEKGAGSVFQPVVAENQLLWGAGDRIVFPWEKDGWLHLYSVPVSGGTPQLLTPGAFEVEYAALSPDRTRVVYNSNQNDIDRRHLWSVSVSAGSAPLALTNGSGIEWQPAVSTTGNTTAFLRADARVPPHVAVHLGAQNVRDITETLPTSSFPAAELVEPQPVIITAADGLAVHGQLFLPKDLKSGEKRPAMIFFHGGSRRQMLLGWHYMYYYRNAYAMNEWLASQGYVVLSVNYRSGIGYGMEFREALNYGATGGSEFRDVMGAGLYLKGRPDVDPSRIGLWGGSYGGYLTAMGLSRASDLFAAGVDMHGVHDWNEGIRTFIPDYNRLDDPEFARTAFDASPLASVDTWRSPVLLVHGDDDRNVSFIQSINLVAALRKRHVEVEQLVLPDEVHDFLRNSSWVRAYKTSADFLQRRLKDRKGSGTQ
ncbi:MAG TPA: prolyl oligopeptidase family serine peptidase [Vicinamibacterales bacterium]|jgi:dipeptidyl aminopeptidase/acylaminoacyl peptidase